jgi:hypothetical protein
VLGSVHGTTAVEWHTTGETYRQIPKARGKFFRLVGASTHGYYMEMNTVQCGRFQRLQRCSRGLSAGHTAVNILAEGAVAPGAAHARVVDTCAPVTCGKSG